MGKARFYYKNTNAPKPNKPNHIGATILIFYKGKVLLESRADSNFIDDVKSEVKILFETF